MTPSTPRSTRPAQVPPLQRRPVTGGLAAPSRWALLVFLLLGQTTLACTETASPGAKASATGAKATATARPAKDPAAGEPGPASTAALPPPNDRLEPLPSPLTGSPLGGEQRVQGPLRVTWMLPQGRVDGDLVGAVGFDRPMVALGTQDDDVVVPWLSFKPALDVRARWVDARTLRFAATKPLPRGSVWRARVVGATALGGATQTEPAEATFYTPRLHVVGVWPRRGDQDVPRAHAVALRFDQGVSEAQVRRALTVRVNGATLPTPQVRVPRIGELTRMLRPTGARFVFGLRLDKPDVATLRRLAGKVAVVTLPPQPLLTQVDLRLAKGLRGAEGPRGLERPYVHRYRVHGPMRLVRGSCERGCDPDHWRPVVLAFSTAVALPGAKQRGGLVRLDPPAKGLKLSCWGARCSVGADFAPATDYALTVSGELADVHGQRLAQDAVVRFRTGDRRPLLGALTEGDVLERTEAPWRWVIEARNQRDLRLQVKRLDNDAIRRWMRSGATAALGAYDVDRALRAGPANETQRHVVDLQRELGLPKGTSPGLTFVAVSAAAPPPRGRYRPRAPRVARLLQVTDLNLHLRQWNDGGLVWLTSLSTGKAVAGAQVEVIDAVAGRRWQGKTGADGLVGIPKLPEVAKSDSRALLATAGDDRTLLRLNYTTRLRGWQTSASSLRHVLFSDKGLYKLGDVAHVKGVLRVLGPTGLELPHGTPTKPGAPGGGSVAVELRTPGGKVALQQTRPLSSLGTFHADLPLPKTGDYGTWEAVVTWGQGADKVVMHQSLRVAVYRPARFTTQVRAERSHIVQGDEVRTHVSGTWLAGGPMAGADASLHVDSQGGGYRPQGWEGWSFGDDLWEPKRQVPAALSHEVKAKLDAQGAWSGAFTARSGHTQPVRLLVEATLRGPSGHEGTASQQVWLHPAALTAALRADRTYWRVGDTVTLRGAAADLQGAAAPTAPVQIRVVRRQYKRIRAKRLGQTWEWETVAVDREVGTCEAPAGQAMARACPFKLTEPGAYVALASVRDSGGRRSTARVGLWVAGPGSVAWHPEGERAPLLSAERTQVRVGEQARLLIRNPWPGATALLTVDRGGVRTSRILALPDSAHQVTVPITADLQPNCHVSVVVYRGRLKAGVGARLDSGGPVVRAAAVELEVDTSAHRLEVGVRPDKTAYRPGDEVQVALDVRDARGAGKAAEVAVLVVDEGVLQLTGHATPDPMAALYSPVSHGVVDHSQLERLVRRRVGEAKGDPGGGGEEGGAMARSDLRDVAWYAPAVQTGADGKALVRFRLPDNLTTFRVTAVAVAGARSFGAGVAKLQVGKPLMVQLRPPRIAELGDRFELSATVRNRSEASVDVDVAATVTGATLTGPPTRRLRVPAGQAREVRFAVQADRVGEVKLEATAVAGRLRDGVSRTLRVVDRTPRDVVATHVATETDLVEAVRRPKDSRGDVGGVQVSISSTGLGTLRPGVDALLSYPFGCAEQTASRLVALAEVARLQRAQGLFADHDAAEIKATTQATVDRLLSLRVRWPQGLFRLWPAARSHGDPLVSAWVLLALKRAQGEGASVPNEVFEQGAKALRKALSFGPKGTERLERQATIAATLSRLQHPEHGTLANLWEARAKLSWVAQLHLADALIGTGKSADVTRAAQLVGGLIGQLRVEGGYATLPPQAAARAGLWGGGARLTGMTLHALAATHPQHALADKLARGLLREQRHGHWGSTQGNAWALLGLGAHYGAAAAPALDFAVFVGQARLAEGRIAGRAAVERLFRLDQSALVAGALTPVQVRRRGTGRLFVGVRYEVVDPVASGVARNAGFSVRRRVLDLAGATDRRRFKRGEFAVVTVTAWSGEARAQVAIRDPIPGGFEVVDFQLAARPRALELALQRAGLSDAASPWTHREVTPTEVRFFADHVAPGQHTWRYVVRAATRGSWRWPGAEVSEMYDPEVRGRSASAQVDIGG